MQRLRTETRDEHQAIEQVVDLLSPALTRASYRRVLERFRGFYDPIEQRLLELDVWANLGLDPDARRKVAWLDANLRDLGCVDLDALPRASRLTIESFDEAVGTSGEFEDDKPRWAFKGDAVYFTSLRDGYRCLWMQRVDPVSKRPVGPPASIRHFHSARLGMMFLALSLLGVTVARDRLVLTLVNRTGGVWLGTPTPDAP